MPWWRIVGALLLCLILAIGAIIVLRTRLGSLGAKTGERFSFLNGIWAPPGARAERRLVLLEVVRLSHQVDLCLLSLDNSSFLLAATPSGAFIVKPDAKETIRPVKGEA